MSHSSGISPSKELVELFANSEESSRALQLTINQETLECSQIIPVGQTFELDLPLIQPLLEKPCFILYRKDSKSLDSFAWILIQFIPENSAVRDKMLYAATKAALLKGIGESKVQETIFATKKDELSLKGIKSFYAHLDANAPLTDREKEQNEHKLMEATAGISISTRSTNASGINFPLSDDAKSAIAALSNVNELVLLTIDTDKETTELLKSSNVPFEKIVSESPALTPLFLFYKMDNDVVFSYVSPPQTKIKERMLFAASRSTVISSVEQIIGTSISKKFEIDSVDELTAELIDPPVEVTVSKPAFSKPARPGRRNN
ncbi:hypothetical protein BC833DRAFT_625112 [Globomyces pollinis-pini]|nr:hypothetical protein BC833DRAFT_625112 [Globomyces pollinis-pini]